MKGGVLGAADDPDTVRFKAHDQPNGNREKEQRKGTENREQRALSECMVHAWGFQLIAFIGLIFSKSNATIRGFTISDPVVGSFCFPNYIFFFFGTQLWQVS
jgi:hypothetical protein